MLRRGVGRRGLRAVLTLFVIAAGATALGGVPSASAVPERAYHGKVSVTKVGAGDGRVTSSPAGIDCGSVCSFSFFSNDVPDYQPVTLTASPNPGSAFDGFEGCGSSCTIDPVEPGKEYTVVAQFSRVRPSTFGLTVGVNGQGRVTSSPSGIDCGTACSATFAADASVTLTAAPTPGWSFSGWTGPCSGTGTCTVTMSAPISVTAVFAPPDSVQALAVATAGGTVTSDILGISCGTQCVAAYGVGVTVVLAASGGPVSWGGACEGTAPTCAVAMTGARTVTASFGGAALGNAPVALSVSGKGTVRGGPGAIDCGAVCGAVVPIGTPVTLSAAPAEGWVFTGWGNACRGVAATCTFAPRGPSTVAATFVEAGTRYPVAVTKAGAGTVTSRPAGISCGAQCTGEFGAGTTAVLAAAPTKGWTFVRWSGACTGSKPSCVLGMDGPKAASATFGRPADRLAPRVRALPVTGSRVATVRLRYRVTDASGRSREVATVYAGQRRLARLRGPQHALDASALYYFISWRRAMPAATRFCISSTDPTGNVSAPSCASVRIT